MKSVAFGIGWYFMKSFKIFFYLFPLNVWIVGIQIFVPVML